MGKGIIIGNSGGIYSEDTTATKADVLAGKTALTSDSNDEVVQGTMQLLSSNSDISLSVMFAHNRTDNWGEGGAIDSPSKGRGIIISMRPEDAKKYALDNSVAFVFMPASDLRPENIRADKTIAKVKGAIPIWSVVSSGFLDMLYAWADQGHAIDHPVAGRGLVVRIPNGYLIEGANWVFLKAPTLLPENIRQGTSVLGIQGTLPDYSAGRVAFNGATFDGTLLSGVANADRGIRFGQVYAQGNISFGNGQFFVNHSEKFKYLGIRDGGLRFSITAQGDGNISYESIAAFFAHSVNLAPFRKIKVGGVILSGSYQKRTNKNDLSQIQFGLVAVSKKNVSKRVFPQQYNYVVDLNNGYKAVHVSFADGAQDDKGPEHSRLAGQQLWAEVDVSDINEQCFMFVYAGGTSFIQMSAEVVINHIEFIN